VTDSQVMEQGWDIAGFFAGIVHNGMPLNGSFQGSVTSGDMLPPEENRLKYPPYFKVVDVYGNINASSSGVGNIRLPFEEETLERLRLEFGGSGVPAMAGFAFCRNGRGTACLAGSFQTVVANGVGYFTDIYIRHPGPGFLLEFEYDGMIGLSKPFNVLPPPPRVTGITFSETFSSVFVNFDAATTLLGKSSTGCERIFDLTSLQKFGFGAQCSWPSEFVLLVTLGPYAELKQGDILSFTASAVFTRKMYWRPVVQSGGIIANQRIFAPDARMQSDSAVIALTSNPMPKLECKPVILPERVVENTVISAERDVTTSDVEHFSMGGTHYFAVANYCQGQNCLVDAQVAFTTSINDLNSSIYAWLPDGTLRLHQSIYTHGATDLKEFVIVDALHTGGYARRQFLAVANYRTTSNDEPDVHSQIWAWDFEHNLFELRQNIRTVGGTSVDVLEHGTDVYIVLTNTGPKSYLTILRWVPGSFREDTNGKDYGWASGQTFGWVPGLFSEPIQDVPTAGAMSAVLYHAYGQTAMFLAFSHYKNSSEGSNMAFAEIYRWREDICYDNGNANRLNISCFDRILRIPAIGAMKVTPFAIEGFNYLAVANHFNGDPSSEQSVHYELDSFIYFVSYTATKESFRLHQVTKRHWVDTFTALLELDD
jgi:hypothetical protein